MPITLTDVPKLDTVAITAPPVEDSIGEYTHAAYIHLHSAERWMPATLTPVTVQSGSGTYGTAVALLAALDTPIQVGKTLYDPHRLFIGDVSGGTALYKIQVIWGASAAAGLAAGTYTETLYAPNGVTGDRQPLEIQAQRIAAGTPLWIRIWASTGTPTMDVWIGVHEYDY